MPGRQGMEPASAAARAPRPPSFASQTNALLRKNLIFQVCSPIALGYTCLSLLFFFLLWCFRFKTFTCLPNGHAVSIFLVLSVEEETSMDHSHHRMFFLVVCCRKSWVEVTTCYSICSLFRITFLSYLNEGPNRHSYSTILTLESVCP